MCDLWASQNMFHFMGFYSKVSVEKRDIKITRTHSFTDVEIIVDLYGH